MADMKLEPITGPWLWTRASLAGVDWITRLQPAEVADLDAAMQSVRSRGLGCGDFERADFPLPVCAPRLAAARAELMHGRGFVVLRGLPVERWTLAEIETVYWGIGLHLGRAITQNDAGDILTHVTMHLEQAGQLAARGYQDRRYQEPHNDRADLVGLLCVRPAQSGGLSSIINSAALYNTLLERHPEYLPVFYRGFRLQLAPGVVTDAPVPVFSHHGGRVHVWFSSRNIERAVQQCGPLPALDQAAFDTLTALALQPEYRLDMALEPGDVQLVSNYAVLHSRTAYEDFPERDRWRLLLRLWLNLDDLDLDPAFARHSRRTVYPDRSVANRR